VPGGGAAELRLRRYPLRIGLGVPLALPVGALVPALGFGADVLSWRATGLVDARAGTGLDPAAELGLSYLAARGPFYLRLAAAGGLTLAPRDFDAGAGTAVLRAPAGYLRATVEVGAVVWKNSPP
jgi:hypothetical protein